MLLESQFPSLVLPSESLESSSWDLSFEVQTLLDQGYEEKSEKTEIKHSHYRKIQFSLAKILSDKFQKQKYALNLELLLEIQKLIILACLQKDLNSQKLLWQMMVLSQPFDPALTQDFFPLTKSMPVDPPWIEDQISQKSPNLSELCFKVRIKRPPHRSPALARKRLGSGSIGFVPC